MFNKKVPILWVLIFIPVIGFTQKCTLKGRVEDSITGMSLSAVSVQIEGINDGTITDNSGFFKLDYSCKDSIFVVFSSVGYESKRLFLLKPKTEFLPIKMNFQVSILDDVIVTTKQKTTATQTSQTINTLEISENANENLSNLLAKMSGVSTLKNGSGIAKPIVQGLYGNRLSILNNGIAQSGQQWGNDHSPEIDPLVANKITVVKGVGALAYPGVNLGSVILIEPKKIDKAATINGQAVYFFESNGLGNGVNLQLQQYRSGFGWKVNGTAKKSGDKSTPTYFLNNTGSEELNLAVQLEKSFSERLFTDVYFSTFNTTLGILRGSHIGNLTDLETAFSREIPFFTEAKFSYQIDAPKQKVQHHLLKFHSKYFINNQKWFDFTIASQLNNRKEFDVRRSGRTEIPALSLRQFAHFAEAKFQAEFDNNLVLKTGFQFNLTDNTNNPETGILPLIPDYLMYENSVYLLLNYPTEKWNFEVGNRYDNVIQNVAAISQTLPREILRYNNVFHNYSTTGGVNFRPTEDFSLAYNVGLVTRNPAINELYSNGLHQGVSGIEQGNLNLKSENSFKTTFSLNGVIRKKLTFEALFYFQKIKNYILLIPQNEIQLTIRGAFPLFRYEQTDAQIWGSDLMLNYKITDFFNLKMTYNLLKGNDLTHDLPLINMPSNQFRSEIQYVIPKWKSFKNITISLDNQYVFQQKNILPSQDFVLPPDAYNLLNLQLATDLKSIKKDVHIFAKAENLLNVRYRDYLNRQRYFADDVGINFIIGCRVKF
jgi:iron complex outermembrane receptor protein